MQIFMPYPDLKRSAQCLDPERLGNQVYRECVTLANGKWSDHPASRIWYPNHVHAIALYALHGLEELYNRGYNYPEWFDYWNSVADTQQDNGLPNIVGTELFHASHRSQLLLKNYYWYIKLGWIEEPGTIPYIWN